MLIANTTVGAKSAQSQRCAGWLLLIDGDCKELLQRTKLTFVFDVVWM
jgi:hypothetical protein